MTCPSCSATVDPSDVICPGCGVNLTRPGARAPAAAAPAGERAAATVPAARTRAAEPAADPEEPLVITCQQCGAAVREGDRRCPDCLMPVRTASLASNEGAAPAVGPQMTRDRPDPPRLRLRFASGDVAVPPGSPVALGRDQATSPAAGTLAKFDNVSRRHALVGVDPDGSAWVEDVHSMNGTFVNDAPVRPGSRVPLRDGDRLRLAADVTAEVSLGSAGDRA